MTTASFELYTHSNFHEDSTTTPGSSVEPSLSPHAVVLCSHELMFCGSISMTTTCPNCDL